MVVEVVVKNLLQIPVSYTHLKKEYENIKNVYEFLISKGFDENEDTVLSAFVLVKRYTGLELQNRVNKLIDIKNNYKKDKSIDYTLLATLDKDIQKIKSEVDKIKRCV